MRATFLLPFLAALALSGCSDTFDAPMMAQGPLLAQSGPNLPHPFTGLKVTSIESLPVMCPCYELLAEAPGKAVGVEFSVAGEYSIDAVRVNDKLVTEGETLKQIAEGLEAAAAKSNDRRIRLVAEALQFLASQLGA